MTYGRKSFIINPMRLALLLILPIFLPILAEAGTVSRLYDFEPGTKAQADQVDAELDNIISTLNGGLNSTNLSSAAVTSSNIASNAVTTAKIADGAITFAKVATGASAYIKDYRKGCNLEYNTTVTQSVNVGIPCQLIVDGWYGSKTVTASAAIDLGSAAASTLYYVYGAPNGSNSIDFEYSSTPPIFSTFRKNGTSSKRYIGSFVTTAAAAVQAFKKTGKDIRYPSAIDFDVAFVAPGFGSSYRIPSFATAIFGIASPVVTTPTGTKAGYCYADIGAASAGTIFDTYRSITNVVSGSNYDFFTNPLKDNRIPAYERRVSGSVIVCYSQYGTVTSSTIGATVYGWEEPAELY